jgi:hypothetical protein
VQELARIFMSRPAPQEFLLQIPSVVFPSSNEGGVQIGLVFKDGFELFFDAQPEGDLMPAVKYRGFNFQEISYVGPTSVIMRAIT